MQISIDVNSGFCFGVVNAIQAAEEYLKTHDKLLCLGDIVHNNMEVKRLNKLGLVIIDHKQFQELSDVTVLIRAHGEPPQTYKTALANNINLLDASCPVVLRLQNNIRKGHLDINKEGGQVVIYGKHGHAEVVGLAGQTAEEAIIISDENDLSKIDLSKSIDLYSQTTKSIEGFNTLVKNIEKNIPEDTTFKINDTICRQVSHRAPQMKEFSTLHDVIIFVSGKKSSNGKYLYSICKETNNRTHFISSTDELDKTWFKQADSVGICGATSTPRWLMDETKIAIDNIKTE
ncbi:MAG: 4-hydroxy-3-methylbut-2-enyl diphosphate reductase [Bacteroidetes bacterium 4572_112]|nr:MAG: 4-hydroxy-3-methylbut-2-enyl diphosphate reductase [Bacteroidetes bacterium 4572_112]